MQYVANKTFEQIRNEYRQGLNFKRALQARKTGKSLPSKEYPPKENFPNHSVWHHVKSSRVLASYIPSKYDIFCKIRTVWVSNKQIESKCDLRYIYMGCVCASHLYESSPSRNFLRIVYCSAAKNLDCFVLAYTHRVQI